MGDGGQDGSGKEEVDGLGENEVYGEEDVRGWIREVVSDEQMGHMVM
jgi:hypothetical protein